jgi:hypothetical protein
MGISDFFRRQYHEAAGRGKTNDANPVKDAGEDKPEPEEEMDFVKIDPGADGNDVIDPGGDPEEQEESADDAPPPYFLDDAKTLDGRDKSNVQQPGGRVQVACPGCGVSQRVRLPSHVSLAEGEPDGTIMRAACVGCGKKLRFTAPPGHKFGKENAVRHFFSRYFAESGGPFNSGPSPDQRVRGAQSAIDAFRQSLRDSNRGR